MYIFDTQCIHTQIQKDKVCQYLYAKTFLALVIFVVNNRFCFLDGYLVFYFQISLEKNLSFSQSSTGMGKSTILNYASNSIFFFHTYFFNYLCIYLEALEKGRKCKRAHERNLLYTGSFPTWLQQPMAGSSGSQELHLGLPCGRQGPRRLECFLLLSQAIAGT